MSGASRGIGYAIAAALLVGGAAVTITARKADELAAAADELARTVAGGADRVLAVPGNAGDGARADAVDRTVEQSRSSLPTPPAGSPARRCESTAAYSPPARYAEWIMEPALPWVLCTSRTPQQRCSADVGQRCCGVREYQGWWQPEDPVGQALFRRRVKLDLHATNPASGLVEHCAARLCDVQHPRLGALHQRGQSWVGRQGAQCRGIPTEDECVQLGGTGQQYPRRGVGRGAQSHSRLTLPPPGEPLLGLPACGGAAVHQPAASAGGEYHAGPGYADAVSTEAYQQQPDRARNHEVVDQILDGEPGLLPGGSRYGSEGHQDRCRRAVTSRYLHPQRRDRSGQRSAVPSREPLQEPGQSLGLDLHRTSTAGKFPDPAHPGTLARARTHELVNGQP